MKYYTSDGFSYCGMTQELITTLRAELGKTTIFITKEEYDVYIASLEN